MAFRLGDIIIDRVQYGLAENTNGDLLYILTQLADSTIDITSESKDATDANGTLIKRFYTAKAGTYTANNAMINTSILTAKSGIPAEIATDAKTVKMPKIVTVKVGEEIKLKDAVQGTVKLNAFYANGTMGTGEGEVFVEGAAASETEFVVDYTDGTLTLPTLPAESEITQFVVKYDREVKDGIKILNSADKFPSTVKLTLKALCVDPCTKDTLRACYIVMPSFQVSPDLSLSLATDGQLEFSGDLQVDYCSADKSLFEFYLAADDEEE